MNSHQINHSASSSSSASASASIDIGNVLNGIWKRKLWIVVTTLVAAAGSVFFVATATPEYQTEARVLVENQETDFSRTDPRRSTGNQIGQQEVKSQLEVLHSRDLAKKVIKKLNLTELREFDPLKSGTGPIGRALISLGFKTDPAKQTPEQRALGAYYKKLTAYQIPESKVIVINMKSKNPKVAAAVANTLGAEFVSETRSVQSRTTGRARDWLADQIDSLRKKVIASEVAAEKFRAQAGLLKGRDGNTTLSNQELSELNSQIILAEAQRAEIQARAKAIRDLLAKTGSVASSTEVLNSPLIQRLRERQITLRGNLAELSTTYLPNHPRVVSIKRSITGLNRQIRSEALKIVSGLEQQAKVATAREASLRASLNGLKSRASDTNLDEVKLRALEREAKANRTLLETFLTKFSDASSREDKLAQPGLARLISRADVPSSPSFPKPGPTVVLATIGGFVLSLGIAFMASVMSAVAGGNMAGAPVERGREKASDEADYQPELQPVPQQTQAAAPAPIAAEVPPVAIPSVAIPPVAFQNPLSPQPVNPISAPVVITAPSLSQLPSSASLQMAQANALSVLHNNGSAFSQGLAPVASWVNSTRQTLGLKRLGVVGLPGAELDTAVMCLGLARSLAAQNMRTIIVDAALQGSPLAMMTGTANLPGVADLLTGYASFLDVIIKDDYTSTRIMRVGKPLEAAWPLLAGDRMETVLSALDNKDNHDIVIVHGGVLAADGSVKNGAVTRCQSSLLVVSADQAGMVGNAMQQLASFGLHSSQYVRMENDGGLQHRAPDNAMAHNAAYAANPAMHSQPPQPVQTAQTTQAGQPAMIADNAPLFSKIAV